MSELELLKSIHFYVTNDSSVMSSLMVGDMKEFWRRALVAYRCNASIMQEYYNGERQVQDNYDKLHYEFTKSRASEDISGPVLRKKIIADAKFDIVNILNAMKPAEKDMLVYRTTWPHKKMKKGEIPFSNVVGYPNVNLEKGAIFESPTFTSTSLTRYLEQDDYKANFYRFEIFIPKGKKVLCLDNYEFHNEPGEIILPPARFKIHSISQDIDGRRGGIIKLEYVESLEQKFLQDLSNEKEKNNF